MVACPDHARPWWRSFMTSSALALAIVTASWTVPAGAAADEHLMVPATGTVSWDDMLRAEASGARSAVRIQRVVPHMPAPPPGEIGGLRVSSPRAAANVQPPPPPTSHGPLASLTFQAPVDNNFTIPPDTEGAAGPSHLVTMLHSQVLIQNKVGGTVSTVSLSTFWTSGTGLSGDPFDPHIVYDSISGRWIAACDADGNLGTSQVWFAISATSSPTGSWTFYGLAADAGFPSGSTWADYPSLGVNGTWIAIGNNMFSVGGSPTFQGAKMWVIDKSTALLGGPLTVTIFPVGYDSGPCGPAPCGSTMQPAVTFSGAEPNLYIVDNSGFSSGGIFLLRLSRITGTGAAPVWSPVPGSSFSGTGLFFAPTNFSFVQIDAPQLGTSSLVSTNDPRVINAAFRNGRLWFTHSGGLPTTVVDRTAVFWYQVDPAAMPAPVSQSGVLDGGSGVHHFFPSITANAADDACIGFSRSDATRYIEGAYTSRFGGDTPGTMDPVKVLKLGEDSYFKTFGGGENRWGDYSATVIDPADDMTCWTLQEYAAPSVGSGPDDDRWATWWGRLDTLPPVPTMTPTPLATPTCGMSQVAGCRTPAVGQKAQLLFKSYADTTKNKLIWKWIKGSATSKAPDFGTPLTTTSYVLCVYDATSALISSAAAPAGGTCNIASPTACWSDKPTGFKYKDKDGTPDGLQQILLKEGIAEKAKISVKGKGSNLNTPPLFPLTQPVTAQLTNGSVCWEATYSAPATKNELGPPGQFKDKAD